MRKLHLADRTVLTERHAFIMGVVNATPDSFYAESRRGVDEALRLIDEGADLLDVGGESTRPGASYISEEDEISRILPVIEGIRKHSSIPISVDTRKRSVMEAAYNAGADIVNDISALEDDEELGRFAADKRLPVILMHKRGEPKTMQQHTSYPDPFSEVNAYLSERTVYAELLGISRGRIIIDPGIGFGKDTAANIALISRCGWLCGGSFPVLMALSRKNIIGELTGEPVEKRLPGTLAANMLAVLSGASLLRVHDVAPCRNMLDVLKSCINSGVKIGQSTVFLGDI